MKGLSAIVATIMLVAFAVAIAGLVGIWFSTFTTGTTQSTSAQSDKAINCASARINFESVTNGSVLYSNPSSQLITNVTVYAGSGQNITYNATNLQPGQVSNATWAVASNTSVFAKGLCQSTIVVGGNCQVGQVCWKAS